MSRINAEALAARGLPVFPIKADAKFPPLWEQWPDRATTTIPADWPERANVGVSCRGLLVLDCDSRKGGDATLDELSAVLDLPDTLTAKSPNGKHLFFRMPAGQEVGNTVEKLGKGLDTRGWNGYVVGVGSTVAGKEYVWEMDVPMADAPAALVQLLGLSTIRERAPKVNVPDAIDAVVDRAREWLKTAERSVKGQGGDAAAYRVAARLRDLGVSELQCGELMRGPEYDYGCGWRDGWLESKPIRSAYRYASGEVGSKAALPDDFPTITAQPAEQNKRNLRTVQFLHEFADPQFQPPPYLVKGLLNSQSYALMYGAPGEGKAQPLDEPVLTPDGWRPMGEIVPGSYVIGSAGLPVLVTAVYPQGKKDEWEVEFENGTVVRCCDEHLWTVYKTGRLPQTITTVELAAKPHKSRWHVPLVQPVSYTSSGNPLPIDPYLLGALIGDGGLTACVGFTSADEEIVREVAARVPAGHMLRHKTGNNGYDYQIVSPAGQPNHVWNALRFLGLAGKKSSAKEVPDEYMRAAPAERLLLLQGLMDTDGWSQGGRVCRFASSSYKLATQVRELVGSLGGVANALTVKHTSGLDSHGVAFSLPAGVAAFRLPRKLARVSQGRGSNLAVAAVRKTGRAVEMQCISVASTDHLYVTTGFVLTHNTFTALDISYHVAAGRPWMGHRVRPGLVLYLPYEGAGGMRKRAQALRQHYGDAHVPLAICPTRANLRTPEGRAELGALIAQLPEKPALIVFDTFAHALCGGDENSAQDVGAFNSGVQALIDHTKACVLVLHHPGKNSANGARGSSALLGAVDTEIEVADRQVRATKQRDIELGDAIGFKLTPITVGIDDDGDDISSCVVEPAKVTAKMHTIKPESQPGRAFKVLCDARPTNDPITEEEWKQKCSEFLPPGRSRGAWFDIKVRLAKARLITIDESGLIRRMLA